MVAGVILSFNLKLMNISMAEFGVRSILASAHMDSVGNDKLRAKVVLGWHFSITHLT